MSQWPATKARRVLAALRGSDGGLSAHRDRIERSGVRVGRSTVLRGTTKKKSGRSCSPRSQSTRDFARKTCDRSRWSYGDCRASAHACFGKASRRAGGVVRTRRDEHPAAAKGSLRRDRKGHVPEAVM